VARVRYRIGDWFAVPLPGGGFAVGLIARADPAGVLLGYFFGPRRTQLPGLHDLNELTAQDAVLVRKFGHLGLQQGKWPLIGRPGEWDPAAWPMPVFIRYEELTGRSFQVFYDEHDPNRVVREVQVPPGRAEQGPKDGLMGAGYTENVLNRLVD